MNVHDLNDLDIQRQLTALRRMIDEGRLVPSNGSDPLVEAKNFRVELESVLKERAAMKAAS